MQFVFCLKLDGNQTNPGNERFGWDSPDGGVKQFRSDDEQLLANETETSCAFIVAAGLIGLLELSSSRFWSNRIVLRILYAIDYSCV